jgi:hypothetical protein
MLNYEKWIWIDMWQGTKIEASLYFQRIYKSLLSDQLASFMLDASAQAPI